MRTIFYIFACISLAQLSIAYQSADKDFELDSIYYYPTQKEGSTVSNAPPIIAEFMPLESSRDSVYDIEGFQDPEDASSSIRSVEDSIYSNYEIITDFDDELSYNFSAISFE